MTSSRSDGRPARRLFAGALGVVLVLGLALPTLAARTQSNLVLIRHDDVVEEDLYAAGNDVQIDGVIEGDLVASAFDEIVITGRVEGSVVAIASRVVVSGEVTGSVRAATPDLEVSGTVGGDVFTGAWSVEVAPEATIGRDILVWAWDVQSQGAVERNIEGQVRNLDVGGVIAGDVEVAVHDLAVLPSTEVSGDVVYTSNRDASVDESAVIDGSLIHERTLPVNVRVRALGLLVAVLSVVAMVALGLAVVWAFPVRAARAAAVLRRQPLAAAGWGLTVVAIPVVVALVMSLVVSLSPREAGVPLALIFLPVLLGVLSLVGLAALTTPVPCATFVGSLIGKERSVYASFVLGFVPLLIAWMIPWVGGIVMLAVLIFGLGGWILSGEDHVGATDHRDTAEISPGP